MSTRRPWVLAVVGLFTTLAVIPVVLASATVDVPSEVSLPLVVLAAVVFRSLRNRRSRLVAP